ncbi:MAG: hypothetical protein GAK43_00764 [Stenotrophomonas maltophilia]|nr:MAG: hypothetical protein GAK43_00764 [Stenotrophomonas maltophilia]
MSLFQANAPLSTLYPTGLRGLHGQWCERRRRQVILAALPRQRFTRVFEPACGQGQLSLDLARRCDSLLCSDASAAQASARHVHVAHAQQPADWPSQRFDLVLLCDLASHLSPAQLALLLQHLRGSLEPNRGVLLACHWRGHPQQRLDGDRVHAMLAEELRLPHWMHVEEEDFLLDIWSHDEHPLCPEDTVQ